MTKMHHVETTNPHAPPYDGEFLRYPGTRPMATEADKIAAAANPGVIWIRFMAEMVDEHPGDTCKLCSTDPAIVHEVQQLIAEVRAEAMAEYGVEWDPSITL